MHGVWIPGYQNRYAVTRDGRVFSVPRPGTKGGWLKQSPNSHGYLRVQLTSADGTQKNWTVHTLVLMTYVGERPEGLQACHGPGGQTDNRLENLRWDTPAANCRDRDLTRLPS